jgi:hypothetical protein
MATDWVHIDTAWSMTNDLQRSLERMTEERDKWREKYEVLLRESCPTCGFYHDGIEPNE